MHLTLCRAAARALDSPCRDVGWLGVWRGGAGVGAAEPAKGLVAAAVAAGPEAGLAMEAA